MVSGSAERQAPVLRWGDGRQGESQAEATLDPRADHRCALLGGAYRIGRSTGSEIRFGSAAVSQQHALLERRGRRWLLRDLGSTNGLWWRGRRVQQLLLVPGDQLRFIQVSLFRTPYLAHYSLATKLGPTHPRLSRP